MSELLKSELKMNQRLTSACIKTILIDGKKYLEFNGARIKRPHVENCVENCFKFFGIEI